MLWSLYFSPFSREPQKVGMTTPISQMGRERPRVVSGSSRGSEDSAEPGAGSAGLQLSATLVQGPASHSGNPCPAWPLIGPLTTLLLSLTSLGLVPKKLSSAQHLLSAWKTPGNSFVLRGRELVTTASLARSHLPFAKRAKVSSQSHEKWIPKKSARHPLRRPGSPLPSHFPPCHLRSSLLPKDEPHPGDPKVNSASKCIWSHD